MRDQFQNLYSSPIDMEDEIDRLFSQLETIQPPPNLVDSILTMVLAQAPHTYRDEEVVFYTLLRF